METEIRSLETTDGIFINLNDVLKMLNKVYRTTCNVTTLKILEALRNGEVTDAKSNFKSYQRTARRSGPGLVQSNSAKAMLRADSQDHKGEEKGIV